MKVTARTSQFASQLALTSSDVGLAANRLQVSRHQALPASLSESRGPIASARRSRGVLAGCPLPCPVCCLEGPQRLYFFFIPPRIQRDDPVVEPLRRVWPLRTICGSKVPLRPRPHRQVHRSDAGQDRLGSAAAAITAARPRRVAVLIAQAPCHLLGQRLLQHGPWSPGTAGHRAEQLRPRRISPFVAIHSSIRDCCRTRGDRVQIAWRDALCARIAYGLPSLLRVQLMLHVFSDSLVTALLRIEVVSVPVMER